MRILNKIKITLPALIVGALFILLQVFNVFYEIEMDFEDKMYQKPSRIPDNIKIIAIDEETLAKLGPYSDWDRSYFADLINILCEDEDNKPKIIGLDILFSGANDSVSDDKLVEACDKAGNVVLASKLDFNSKVVGNDSDYYIYEYVEDEVTAFDKLNAVTKRGFTNAKVDKDGFLRKAYTVIGDEKNGYKSFPYVIANLYSGDTFDDISRAVFEFRYSGKPGEFETFAMSKVLDGSIPASYFADSIVLVGAHEEGMLDAYRVAIDHSNQMYGVEIHANVIQALLEGKEIKATPMLIQCLIMLMLLGVMYYGFANRKIRTLVIAFACSNVLYYILVAIVYAVWARTMSLMYMPLALVCMLFTILVLKYIWLQKRRAQEMQRTLFSMADSMAEAIEGRTPYNASHTKNVARRCEEMLGYINEMHKKGRTDMHFTTNDIKQIGLAAMLHDIGKMDVPLEVMDKPTKLGSKEEKLRDRLLIIRLKIENDSLKGIMPQDEADERMQRIDAFVSKLGLFNCGKPLSDEEKAIIEEFGQMEYKDDDGNVIPYLTKEELADLNIKAGTLSDEERTIMQSHVIHTDKILSHVYFGSSFDKVRTIASDHHELLNGKGYPNGKDADKLDVLTRILTIMDIYDSLIADDRPYKKAKPVKVAFEILDEEAEAGKVDKELLEIAKEIWLVEDGK